MYKETMSVCACVCVCVPERSHSRCSTCVDVGQVGAGSVRVVPRPRRVAECRVRQPVEPDRPAEPVVPVVCQTCRHSECGEETLRPTGETDSNLPGQTPTWSRETYNFNTLLHVFMDRSMGNVQYSAM